MFAFDFLFKEISGLFSNKFHANNFTDIYFLQKENITTCLRTYITVVSIMKFVFKTKIQTDMFKYYL